MSIASAIWHDRQLEHVREALAEADKRHTPEEVAAAEAALAQPIRPMQDQFHFAPPNTGLITGGQPEPSGLAEASSRQPRRAV